MTIVRFNQTPVFRHFPERREFTANPFASLTSGQPGKAVAPANIFEAEDGYHLELQAPGRNREDFKLEIQENRLIISSEKEDPANPADYRNLRREFRTSSFRRSFPLDDSINTDGIQARYENGILRILLPRKAESNQGSRQINVQ